MVNGWWSGAESQRKESMREREQQPTFDALNVPLEDDTETIEVDAFSECGGLPLLPGVLALGVGDQRGPVLWGDLIFVRQSLTRPVARGWTTDEDSNGSIARDRFNLRKHCYRMSEVEKKNTDLVATSPVTLRFPPIGSASASSTSDTGSVGASSVSPSASSRSCAKSESSF